jgi:hypothetical protein
MLKNKEIPGDIQGHTLPNHKEEEDDDDDDEFLGQSSASFPKIMCKQSRSNLQRKIVIKITSIVNSDSTEDDSQNDAYKAPHGLEAFRSPIIPDHSSIQKHEDLDLEQSLVFFTETHEDQSPIYQENIRLSELQKRKKELEALEREDEKIKNEISDIVKIELQEKLKSIDKNIHQTRQTVINEEQMESQRIKKEFDERSNTHLAKIQQGIKLLTRRHGQEMQKQAQQHRLSCQQRGVPDSIMNAEWAQFSQQLQEKQKLQIQELQAKGEELKRRNEQDFHRDREKHRISHEKRVREIEQRTENAENQIRKIFEDLHHRHLKRHMQRMNTKKQDMLAHDSNTTSPVNICVDPREDILKNQKEKNSELLAPLSIKSRSIDEPFSNEGTEHPAAARYRYRKAAMSSVRNQLSIEIHNEGLWISAAHEKVDLKHEENKQTSKAMDLDAEFIPWSLKAREILHAIICGEIPYGYGSDRFDFGDSPAQQGGCIRCVVTDLRVGETTASKQRAECMREVEEDAIQDLEKKAVLLTKEVTEAEKPVAKAEHYEKDCVASLDKATKEVLKAKKHMAEFKSRFGHFFGIGKICGRTSKYESCVTNRSFLSRRETNYYY